MRDRLGAELDEVDDGPIPVMFAPQATESIISLCPGRNFLKLKTSFKRVLYSHNATFKLILYEDIP